MSQVIEDCKHFIQETITLFGRQVKVFQDYAQISDLLPVSTPAHLQVSIVPTYEYKLFAIPHQKKTKGKIVAVASPAGWSGEARMSIYAASKAAMINFNETLRIELGLGICDNCVSGSYRKW